MKTYKNDIPVFMIFFNRPDTLRKVFDAVKEARPSKLFLACDGPRNGKDDATKIAECKKIVEDIDWECEVYKNYSDVNLGCGMRMYSGLNWAFEFVDRIIVLEDDCVPHQDFFPFCSELLERYKSDDRICMISAMNHLGIYDRTPYDYFFAGGCCWGWATWKDRWEKVDFNMGFLSDEYSVKCAAELFPYYSKAETIGAERKKKLENGEKLTAWTYQWGMNVALNNQMSIIPSKNLITNIGLTTESVHAPNDKRKLPKKLAAYFDIPAHSINFPLKHPQYIVEDRFYYQAKLKKFELNFFDRLEGILRKFIFSKKGEFKKWIFQKLKKH